MYNEKIVSGPIADGQHDHLSPIIEPPPAPSTRKTFKGPNGVMG